MPLCFADNNWKLLKQTSLFKPPMMIYGNIHTRIPTEKSEILVTNTAATCLSPPCPKIRIDRAVL